MDIYPAASPTLRARAGDLLRRVWARFTGQRLAWVALECAVVIGLLALLYLSQVGAVTSANASLQSAQARQTSLRRQNAQAHAQLAAARNPAYIDQRARAMGLAPVTTDTPSRPIVIPVHVQPLLGQSSQGAR